MKVYAGITEFHIEEPTVVTIGKFDGRHKGHQKLLAEMKALREAFGYKIAVFTFAMSPAGVVTGKKQTVITTNEERRANMAKSGIDYLVEYPFNEQIAHMAPEDFVKKILVDQMGAKAVVAGPDCGFGYKRAGNVQLLEKLAPECGYQIVVIEKEQDDHRDISSTYIREELDQGNMEKVTELLGEPYAVHGEVVHGNHLGGPVLGFPTVNILPPPEKHLPPFGVYVSRVYMDGKYYGGVTNVGRKPTVEGNAAVGVETFILDLEGQQDLYGKYIEVQLFNYERPEQKFQSFEELKARIELDKKYASEYWKTHKC